MNPRMEEFLQAVAALRRGFFGVDFDRPEVAIRQPGCAQETVIRNGKNGTDEYEVRPAHPQTEVRYDEHISDMHDDIKNACVGTYLGMLAPTSAVDAALIQKVQDEITKAQALLLKRKQEKQRLDIGIEQLEKVLGDPVVWGTKDGRLLFTGLNIPEGDYEVYYRADMREVAYLKVGSDEVFSIPLLQPVGRDQDGNYKPLDEIKYGPAPDFVKGGIRTHATPLSDILSLRERLKGKVLPSLFEATLASGSRGYGRTAEEAEINANENDSKGLTPVCGHKTIVDGRCAACRLPM